MAIQAAKYKDFNIRKKASESLARQMSDEEEAESGLGSFMSIAAPLAASFLLPGIGTALMGGLGGMAGGAGIMGTLLGGAGTAAAGTTAATAGTGLLGALAGTGTGLASTIGGGLLTGGAKAAGTYAIGEGLEGIGRSQGYGADVDEIDLSQFGRRGVRAEVEGKEKIQSSMDAMEEGQRKSALMSGLTAGVDQMGGFDKMKEMLPDYVKSKFKGSEVINPADKGLGMGQAAGDTGMAQAPSIASIGDKSMSLADQLSEVDTLGAEQLDPLSFQASMATEGASPVNFLTGKGAQVNLLDSLPSYSSQPSIMDSMTQFTPAQSKQIAGIIEQYPNITPEELEEYLASMGG